MTGKTDTGGVNRAGRRKALSLGILFFLTLLPVFSQTFGRGAILDPEWYKRVPEKAVLAGRSYTEIPRSVSLKQYTLYPGNQGRYGTCTAWSAAYAARTIAESLALSRQDRTETTGAVFSPVFVYKNISSDPGCESGTCISDALDLMKDPGIVKMAPFERERDFPEVPLSWYEGSRKYPIADYTRLYMVYKGGDGTEPGERVLRVKKALAEGKPVVIGMLCPDSFNTAKEVWIPAESPDGDYGGHALCVVGYDDQKYGGAFEIQNSWGNWGNEGYIWISYTDFSQFVYEAYELIEDLLAYEDGAKFAASVTIERYGPDKEMPVRFSGDGYYRTISAYPSGTEFRFLLENRQPAYVYAFAGEGTA